MKLNIGIPSGVGLEVVAKIPSTGEVLPFLCNCAFSRVNMFVKMQDLNFRLCKLHMLMIGNIEACRTRARVSNWKAASDTSHVLCHAA